MKSNDIKIMDSVKHLFSGSLAGIGQAVVGHPLDTIKVRMVESKQNSIIGCCKMMIKQNGLRSFYQGIRAPLYGSVFQNALIFGAYETSKNVMNINKNDRKDTKYYNKLIGAASLTSIPMTLIESPIEFLKCQMQVNKNYGFRSIYQNVKPNKLEILRRGFKITLARNIIQYPSYFVSFEFVKNQFPNNLVLGSLIGGSVAGVCTWGIPYPLDYYKTCLQSDSLDPNKRKYKGLIDVVKRSSLKDCYRGFYPCILRAVPVNAAVFLIYSMIKDLIE